MNRKKKICIVIIIVLTFVILGNLLLFFTKKDIKVAKNQENQLQDENIATENSINNKTGIFTAECFSCRRHVCTNGKTAENDGSNFISEYKNKRTCGTFNSYFIT